MTSHYLTIIGYLAELAAGLTLQGLALAMPHRLPTDGQVFTHVMRSTAGRAGIFVAWVWLGLHFFAW